MPRSRMRWHALATVKPPLTHLTLVREVMTRDPRTIAAEASLVEAHALMRAGGFRHLDLAQAVAVAAPGARPAPGGMSRREIIPTTSPPRMWRCG
jgi:hypothetical protein